MYIVELLRDAINSFLGITDSDSKWWKAAFERKILKGLVGVPLRWMRNTDIDLLWEFESLVVGLSHTDVSAGGQVDTAQKTPRERTPSTSIHHQGYVHDCHRNNFGSASQDRNMSSNTGCVLDEKTCPEDESHVQDTNTKKSDDRSGEWKKERMLAEDSASVVGSDVLRNGRAFDGFQSLAPNLRTSLGPARSQSLPNISVGAVSTWESSGFCPRSISVPDRLYDWASPAIHLDPHRVSESSAHSRVEKHQTHRDYSVPAEYGSKTCTHLFYAVPHNLKYRDHSDEVSQFEEFDCMNITAPKDNKVNIRGKLNARGMRKHKANSNCHPKSGNSASVRSECMRPNVSGQSQQRVPNTNNCVKVGEIMLNGEPKPSWVRETANDFPLNVNAHHAEVHNGTSSRSGVRKFEGQSNSGSAVTSSEIEIQSSSEHHDISHCPVPGCDNSNCLLSGSHQPIREQRKSHLKEWWKQVKQKLTKTWNLDDDSVTSEKQLRRTLRVGCDISAQVRHTSCYQRDSNIPDFAAPMTFDLRFKPLEGLPSPMKCAKRSLGLDPLSLPDRPLLPETSILIATTGSPRPLGDPLVKIRRRPKVHSGESDVDGWVPHDQPVTLSVSNPTIPRDLEEDTSWEPSNSSEVGVKYLLGAAAYKHYTLLTTLEKNAKMLQMKKDRDNLLRIYRWKQEMLMRVIEIARDYYSNPTETNRRRWRALKADLSADHQSNTDVRVAVSALPDRRPFFSTVLVMIQLLTLGLLTYRYGLAPMGVQTLRLVYTSIPTLLGTETIVHLREPNPWIGPPVQAFIDAGASLAPCMRRDSYLNDLAIKRGYRPFTLKNRLRYFGCCEMGSLFNSAGTTTLRECREMTGDLGSWQKGVVCGARAPGANSVAHIIRPCCVGVRGACLMVSQEHCMFIDSVFHRDLEHCVQVNCLDDVCNLGNLLSDFPSDSDSPWRPGLETSRQWWRLLTAIPHTHGVLHLLVLIIAELTLMVPLEMSAGVHRVILIYVLSSIAGQMAACMSEPVQPHEGATSGLMGVVGVAVLELVQAWKFIQRPWLEVSKIVLLLVVILGMGTFHLINLAGALMGLIVGMMTCLLAIPYITFGHYLGYFRIRLVLLSLVMLIPIWLCLLILFHSRNSFRVCTVSATLECIQYTAVMCRTYIETTWDTINVY